MTTDMKTKRLCPWFGADEAVGQSVGAALAGCKWVGVGFAGGMGVLKHIQCRGGVANDRHCHVINLCRVVRDGAKRARLIQMLDAALFHPAELVEAQKYCRAVEEEIDSGGAALLFNGNRIASVRYRDDMPQVDWAYHYFLAQWLGRSGIAGTDGEFNGKLSTRWNANGGGSNVRFRSAAAALDGFGELFKGWEFECMDVFDFLEEVIRREEEDKRKKKDNGRGVYSDAPWPEDGDGYKHKFDEKKQRRLAEALWRLATANTAQVVIRFGDHPLIREIYTEDRWELRPQGSRDQANQAVPELLIVNRIGGGG